MNVFTYDGELIHLAALVNVHPEYSAAIHQVFPRPPSRDTAVGRAIQLRKEIDNEWMLILSGVLSVLFGAYMLMSPTRGALAVVWIIAVWSIAFGVLLASAAFRLKRARDAGG